MVYLKYFCFAIACTLLFHIGNAQDCTLNIGGKDTETIIKIFQLNDGQIGQMEGWRSELEIETSLIEDQIQELMDKQPQKTPEELIILAEKYNVLKEKMVNVSKIYDKKLIGIFNQRQYQRYVDLCNEAFRRPMVVDPD